jgi:calcitonin receptor-like
MDDSHTQWILTAPVLISMVASTIFLVNVVRILLTKLHSASDSPAPLGMRKAVRATLILIPLFGIHHILLPFRPEPGQPGEKVYQVFSAVVVSLQVRMPIVWENVGLESNHLLWLLVKCKYLLARESQK